MGDMQERSTGEIREMGVQDEILPTDEYGNVDGKAWNSLRNLASRKGYCGGRKGMWQKPAVRARVLDD